MIKPPRRAVTRFFVPLIDVLILLFCIFLLMPFAEKEAGSGKLSPGEAKVLRDELDELRRRLANMSSSPESVENLKMQIAQLLEREAQRKNADQVLTRTLQIDGKTGVLSYIRKGPAGDLELKPIRNDSDAENLMIEDEASLQGTEKTELLYVIVYPVGRTRYPEVAQEDAFRHWFPEKPRSPRKARVSLRLEDPRKSPGGT